VVPQALNPITWLGLAEELPRMAALLLVLTAVAMLLVGQRFFPMFVRLGVAAGAWVGGLYLARLMLVADWTMALSTSLLAVVVTWRLANILGALVIGFCAGCGAGAVAVLGLQSTMFWIAFAGTAVAGTALALLLKRFVPALFSAAFGVAAVLSGLGAVVRAPEGFFSVGGYRQYPMVDVVIVAVLFVGAVIMQVVLEPESATGHEGAK